MKKPLYRSSIVAWVFLSLGLTFPVFGFLAYFNILKPTPQSKLKDPIVLGQNFLCMGLVCLMLALSIALINYKLKMRQSDLLLNGKKILGTVEKISLLRKVTIGKKNPYQVHYSYWYEGNEIHKKSHLLWEKPSMNVGDTVNVYINEKGQVACDL